MVRTRKTCSSTPQEASWLWLIHSVVFLEGADGAWLGLIREQVMELENNVISTCLLQGCCPVS